MKDTEAADQVAADLVLNCYGKLGVLSAVVRIEGGTLRLIAPDGHYEALAMLLYRAADECAAHAKSSEPAWKPNTRLN